ncbi:MAG: hypothetical protein ACI87E_003167 [Mariniblastus sp.]|jgi:hypothetical protein
MSVFVIFRNRRLIVQSFSGKAARLPQKTSQLRGPTADFGARMNELQPSLNKRLKVFTQHPF